MGGKRDCGRRSSSGGLFLWDFWPESLPKRGRGKKFFLGAAGDSGKICSKCQKFLRICRETFQILASIKPYGLIGSYLGSICCSHIWGVQGSLHSFVKVPCFLHDFLRGISGSFAPFSVKKFGTRPFFLLTAAPTQGKEELYNFFDDQKNCTTQTT